MLLEWGDKACREVCWEALLEKLHVDDWRRTSEDSADIMTMNRGLASEDGLRTWTQRLDLWRWYAT
jgi:hypothetical protein